MDWNKWYAELRQYMMEKYDADSEDFSLTYVEFVRYSKNLNNVQPWMDAFNTFIVKGYTWGFSPQEVAMRAVKEGLYGSD